MENWCDRNILMERCPNARSLSFMPKIYIHLHTKVASVYLNLHSKRLVDTIENNLPSHSRRQMHDHHNSLFNVELTNDMHP
jgi:hypothetical protein